MVKKYSDLYLDARKALLDSAGESAALVARQLLCRASGKTPEQMLRIGSFMHLRRLMRGFQQMWRVTRQGSRWHIFWVNGILPE